MTDEELVTRPIKEINKSFKSTGELAGTCQQYLILLFTGHRSGLPTSDQTKMKKKRRTLKNRGYAKTTRRKKEEESKRLEKVRDDLKVCLMKSRLSLMIFLWSERHNGDRERLGGERKVSKVYNASRQGVVV